MTNSNKLAALLFVYGGLALACRGNIPPTEPPHTPPIAIGEGSPETRTNDAPTAGPLAGDGGPTGSGSGGSSVLPMPDPHPGGSSGSAGSGVH